jgi:DNA-binding LacI/PurR family transcriptional regulator
MLRKENVRATLKDIAEKAGVSKMTASNVLRGREDQVSSATRDRVLEVARELNYIPIRPALQNRHIPTRTLGFISDREEWASGVEMFTYSGIRNGCLHVSYDLMLLLRSESDWVVANEDAYFLDRRCDGLIFLAPRAHPWQGALQSLVEHGTPVVACYSRDVPEGVGWVDPDNEGAVEQTMNHLLNLGHRRIAFWTAAGDEQLFDIYARRRAYENIMQKEDLEPIVVPSGEVEENGRTLQALISQGVTACFCFNDWMALQLCYLARQAKLEIPRDFSLAGIDDWPSEQTSQLTTSRFHYTEVGRHAVDALLALLAKRPLEEARRIVPIEFLPRASTAPPRS